MRIRTTTRAGASPHPISITTATDNSVGSGHGRAPSPAVLVYGGPQAILSGLVLQRQFMVTEAGDRGAGSGRFGPGAVVGVASSTS